MHSLRIETFYDIRVSHHLFALHVELYINIEKNSFNTSTMPVSVGCIAIVVELKQKCR